MSQGAQFQSSKNTTHSDGCVFPPLRGTVFSQAQSSQDLSYPAIVVSIAVRRLEMRMDHEKRGTHCGIN